MSKKPDAPGKSAAPTTDDTVDAGQNGRVKTGVAIGIGSAAIVAALMFVRRR